MPRNKLKPHMLKDMQMSFLLTEKRKPGFGGQKPETKGRPPLGGKPAASGQAAKKPPHVVASPQKGNPQKRSSEQRATELGPSQKKRKKDAPAPAKVPGAQRTIDNSKAKATNTAPEKGAKNAPQKSAGNQSNFDGAPSQKKHKKQSRAAKLKAKASQKRKDKQLLRQNPDDGTTAGKVRSKVDGAPPQKKNKKQSQKKKGRQNPENGTSASRVPALPSPFAASRAPKTSKAKGKSKPIVAKIPIFDEPLTNGFGDESDAETLDDLEPSEERDLESDGFYDADEDLFGAPKIFNARKGLVGERLSLLAPFEADAVNTTPQETPGSQGSVRKIVLFEDMAAEEDLALARVESEDSEDAEWSVGDESFGEETECSDSEDFDSEDCDFEEFDSEDCDSEDFDSEDSSDEDSFDSETFDFSTYNSDLDSTFEPSDLEESIEDLPPHLRKEPLIIEEIFDDPPVQEAPLEAEKNGKAIAGPLKNISEEEPELQNDAMIPNDEPIPTPPVDAPFYRNPEALPAERSIFENSLKSNHVLAVIKEDVEFYGTVELTLLSGQVTINGFKARRQQPVSLYSPKGLNWVCVSPAKSKQPARDEVQWEELNENFSLAQLNRIRGNVERETDAVVLLQRNTAAQRLVETFGKHMAQNVFPQVNASNRPHHLSESLLQCLVQSSDGQRTLQVPQVWNKLRLHATSRVLVAGGKGVGKSSLVRYLVNRNLGQFPKLLLVDLDIGQPELFVPQTVSCTLLEEPLTGPGFLLNKQPDRAHVVGHVNIVLCAQQYARAVTQLARHIQKEAKYQNVPWLINTMGYNKGFGTELMALLVDRLRPTDLVQIASPLAINNFDAPLEWSALAQVTPIIFTAEEWRVKEIPRYTLHRLTSAVPPKERGAWSMSAKDLRYSNLLARLSACVRGSGKSLADSAPAAVSLDALKILHPTGEEYTRQELVEGMEANVVYLCHQTGAGLPECLGIGVVRAIDHERGKLFLVPAMPLARLALVDCLVLGGELTLPQGYFRDQGAGVSSNVPFVFILDDCKSSRSIQQIYHRTPAFLGVPGHQR